MGDCDGFCSGGSSGSSRISSFPAPSALMSATPPAVTPSSLSSSRPPCVSGLLLLPSAPFPWPVSLALALGSYLVVRGFHGCFRVLPILCYTLSPVSALRCCPLHQLSLCFAAPPSSSAGSSGFAPSSTVSAFGPGGSAHQPGPSSVFLRCLGLLQLLPSSSLSVWLRSCCPFAPGLLVQSLPVLRLRFLRL